MWNNVEHNLPLRSDTHDVMAEMYVRLDTIKRGLSDDSEAAQTAARQNLSDVVERLQAFLVQHERVLAEESGSGFDELAAGAPNPKGANRHRQKHCHVHDVREMGGKSPDFPCNPTYAVQAEARKRAARAFRRGRSKRRSKGRRR